MPCRVTSPASAWDLASCFMLSKIQNACNIMNKMFDAPLIEISATKVETCRIPAAVSKKVLAEAARSAVDFVGCCFKEE